ncbi:MAG: hypothetical protein FJX77_00245, partial [Armatimonadetes bacterium]|nr:hypothetical protein [Armatimonadota bacterium]
MVGLPAVWLTAEESALDAAPPGTDRVERILEPGGIARLHRWLGWGGGGFRLAVVEAATPAGREIVLEWLEKQAAREGRILHRIDLRAAWRQSREDILAYLRNRFPESPQDGVLALYNVEEAVWAPTEGLLRQLNVQRGLFTTAYPCPWVVFVHPSGRLKMVDRAPDFFDFASLRVFAAHESEARAAEAPRESASRSEGFPPLGPPPVPPTDTLGTCLRDAWESLERFDLPAAADQIERAFLMPGGPDSPWLPVLRAELEWYQDNSTKALELLGQVSTSDQLLIPAGVAATLLQARIEIWRGNIRAGEERLRALLPRLDGPGLAAERAEVLGELAAVLAGRGELTQALQILQADCLPEFERLQDVRSRAITWGKIADIRQARGDL